MTRSLGGRLAGVDRASFFAESVKHRFVHDARGRLVDGSSAGSSPVPRFYLGRSLGLTLWRFSAVLEPECVLGLARLAALERPLSLDAMTRLESPPAPERMAAFGERLAGKASGLRFRGPLLALGSVVGEDAPGKARYREFAPTDETRGPEKADSSAGPGVFLEVAGEVVASCRSLRHWPGWGAECVVETMESERGRGYGRAALKAWCEAIRRRGEIPLARPRWSDRRFLVLARLLGADFIGEEFEFD